jgi:hypothetical protein
MSDVYRATQAATMLVQKACDEAERQLTLMAKDKQCDEDDLKSIVYAREKIKMLREAT